MTTNVRPSSTTHRDSLMSRRPTRRSLAVQVGAVAVLFLASLSALA